MWSVVKASILTILFLIHHQAFSMACGLAVSGGDSVSLDLVVQSKIKTASLALQSSLASEGHHTQSFLAVLRSLSKTAISDSLAVIGQVSKLITPVAGTETSQTLQEVIQAYAQIKSGDFKKGWGFGSKKTEAEIKETIISKVKVLSDRMPVITSRLLELEKAQALIEASIAQLKSELQVLTVVKQLLLKKKVAESGRIHLSEALLQVQDLESVIQNALKTLTEQKDTISKADGLLTEEQSALAQFLDTQLNQMKQTIEKDIEFSKKLALAMEKQYDRALQAAVDLALAKSKGSVLTPELLETPFRELMHGDQVKVFITKSRNVKYYGRKSWLGVIMPTYRSMDVWSPAIEHVFSAQVEIDRKDRKKLVFWAQKHNFVSAKISFSNPSIQRIKWPLGNKSEYNLYGKTGEGSKDVTQYRFGRENYYFFQFNIILANPDMKIGNLKIGNMLKVKSEVSYDTQPKFITYVLSAFKEARHWLNIYSPEILKEDFEAYYPRIQSGKFEVLGTSGESVALALNSNELTNGTHDKLFFLSKDDVEEFFELVPSSEAVTK